ncbi:MAG: mannitol dehydrogenase family protein [Rhodospirillales bacterium]
MNAIPLNKAALEHLPHNVSPPGYDRESLTPGIVHIGVGNFHRAHQAAYMDRLFAGGGGRDWGVIGAGVMPGDAKTRAALLTQDCLTTVVELDAEEHRASVNGAMIGYAPPESAEIIDILSRPEIRMATLTVTEGGYFINAETGGFDAGHPDIAHDLQNPERPRTVFGMLLAALMRRREKGVPPFTVVSCDNLPENGAAAHRAVSGLAEGAPNGAAAWIDAEAAFPNSMVDCITPATTGRVRALVESQFGIRDQVPVVCEPFRQWVLEDRFAGARPPLEDVGVEFVDDVALYELMKLRILNGGHALIGYAGALLGLEYAHEAMNNPLIRGFFERVEKQEIIPTLTPIPGVDFHAYLASVSGRFANPGIKDKIERLCLDGSNRQPKFILPTVTDRLAAGQPVDGLALETALWCRYCMDPREDGAAVTLENNMAEMLSARAGQAQTDPAAFLSVTQVFGPLGGNPVFAEAFSRALNSVLEKGAAETLRAHAAAD